MLAFQRGHLFLVVTLELFRLTLDLCHLTLAAILI